MTPRAKTATADTTPSSPKPSRRRKAPSALAMLLDGKVPLEMRLQVLGSLLQDDSDTTRRQLAELLEAAARGDAETLFHAKTQELADLIERLQQGPLRSAVFLGLVHQGEVLRARVNLPDGQTAFCSVPDPSLAEGLRRGDEVWLDAQATAVMFRAEGTPALGDEMTLERRLPPDRVEVRTRDDGRSIVLASQLLCEQLDAGEAGPGATVLVNERLGLALEAVAQADGLSHYRYLQRQPVPDVVVERDVGAPPELIQELTDHVRMELTEPGTCERWGLPRCRTWLLTGLPGTGKTLSILATWRRMYEVMSEHTGVPVDELPPRVLRLRVSEVLSKWLGESDKAIDRFFDEVEELAATPWEGPDGRLHELPVLLYGEEIDGLARARGQGEGVHDRILTTLLERLDTLRTGLGSRLVLGLFTTNVPGLVDAAFLRRAGGKETKFGTLGEGAFRAVLDRQLGRRPLRDDRGSLVSEVSAWLFGASARDPGDGAAGGRGVAELHFAGRNGPEVLGHRHFLTGALVDRSVQAASAAAAREAWGGDPAAGLDAPALRLALHEQVRAVVDRLTPLNAASHIDLPEGQHLVRVRPLADERPPESFQIS